jgi:hypothetical protein
MVMGKVLALTVKWRPICKAVKVESMKSWCTFLEQQIREPLMITNG